MHVRWVFSAALLLVLSGGRAGAVQADLPTGQKEPLLRVEGGGPTSSVTALVFSPDGKKLYAAGYDKVVRVWSLDAVTGKFVLERAAYRVLVGPGQAGAINCLALSPGGDRLAVGGLGLFRGGMDFRDPGFVFPQVGALDSTMRQDQGMIYVYKTDSPGNKPPEVRLLRGHRGPVLAMTFAAGVKDTPLLVSAAREWDEKASAFAGMVRVWDVHRGVCLATLKNGLPATNVQPGLAVWPTGARPGQLRVAIAWGDGKLRLWDVERGAKGLRSFDDGPSNTAVAYIAGSKPPRILTTSFQPPRGEVTRHHGRLQAWDVLDDFQEKPRQGPTKLFLASTQNGKLTYFKPVAIEPLSARGNGTQDHVAVLVRLSGRNEKVRMQLIELAPKAEEFGDVKVEHALWPADENSLVLAAAANGRHLAVAGNKEHEINVYRIPNLLNKHVREQVLHSAGVAVGELSFVRNGKALGLTMRVTDGHGQVRPRLVFDFTNRLLSADTKRWKKDGPDLGDWRLEGKNGMGPRGVSPREYRVFQGETQKGKTIRIGATQEVTEQALLPPMKPLNTPILALAYLDYESGEAGLALYNVTTGERVRQLTGHVDPIRSLAFSADGRLLASAAEDQTVCLWSLTQLGNILNRRGMLGGLAVIKGKDGVVVKQVKKDSPARGKLEPGDRIEGLVLADDKFQPLDSPRKFYETMWQKRPADTVELRVAGKENVRLKVGQGVDQRNALLSLFFTRAAKVEDQEWIAWSPVGYYDASARKAERHLLWHFNKSKASEPTATAQAGQFRKEYERRGLLKFLIARGSLGSALEDWKKEQQRKNRPRPNLMLWIGQVGPDPNKRDGQGRVPVQSRRVTLKLSLGDFPFEEGDTVQWQFEGGPWQEFRKRGVAEWSVPLARVPWKRGTNRVRAILRTDGDGPQRFTEELTLSYQPPPPEVIYKGGKRQVVSAPKFIFKASVEAGAAGEEPSVTVSHRHAGKELLKGREPSSGQEINEKLTLRPGSNLIQVVARNKDALKGSEERETARLTVEVIYTKKDDPPRIALEVEAGGVKKKVEPGVSVIVHDRRVRLTGTIKAGSNLTRAEWSADGNEGRSLTDFAGDKQKTFSVNETVVLKPGLKPRVFRFLAKTANSDESLFTVRIAYRPRLPRVALTGPADETVLYQGDDQPLVKVEGQLTWPDDFQPCRAEILVNGKVAATQKIDKQTATLTEQVRLSPGDNRIQVRLSNDWKGMSTSEAVAVRYLRPPRIQFVDDKQPRVTRKSLIDLSARVTSALPLKSVRAEVNGPSGRRIVKVKMIPPANKKADVWTVRLADVSLDAGKNEVLLFASNEEASSRKPATLAVSYDPPPKPPRPPEVELIYPAVDVKVTSPELTVRARIRSARALKRVELIQQGRKTLRIPVDLSGLKPNPQGFYEVAAVVKLNPQENLLRLEAVNAGGGRQSPPIAVNYIPQRPVRVEIQHLLVRGSSTKILPLPLSSGNSLRFGEVPRGRVQVVGRVTWDAGSDKLMKKDYEVDVFVNGLRQLPAELAAASGNQRERTFKTEVILTRARDNDIQMELPAELKRNADNHPRYLVGCRQPVKRQRLYLLPIAVGAKDDKKLIKQLFEALQAEGVNGEPDRFRTPTFAEGRLYGPLTGYVNRRQVLTQLNRIKQEMLDQKRIDLRTAGDAPSDVLMLYFRGGDSVSTGRYAFRTSDRRVAITREQLMKEFQETLGAQILFLDVARETSSGEVVVKETARRVARWPDDSRISVFRYAWQDAAEARKNEPLFIDTLGRALRRAGKLQEVATEVKTQFEKMPRLHPKLAFYEYYPQPLGDLLLGSKR